MVEDQNRLKIAKYYFVLWALYAVSNTTVHLIDGEYLRVAGDLLKSVTPAFVFYYFVSVRKQLFPIYLGHYYLIVLISIDAFALPASFSVNIFLVMPLILSAHILMPSRQALLYAGAWVTASLFLLWAQAPILGREMAVAVPEDPKYIFLVLFAFVLAAGLLNYFKSLYDNNIDSLSKTMTTLKEYNTDNELLINIISHDINNQLSRLLMSVEVLDRRDLKPEKFQKYHARAISEVIDLRDIIHNFQSLRKLNSSELEFKLKPISIQSLVNKMELMFSGELMKKDLTFKAVLDPDISEVYVEPISFSHHLMANLIGNAIKFSSVGQKIEFATRRSEEKIEFMITNYSHREHTINLQKITDKKSVISKLGTQNEVGQGLGLKLVREVGEFSKVEWHMTWEQVGDEQLKVTNHILIPDQPSAPSSGHNKGSTEPAA